MEMATAKKSESVNDEEIGKQSEEAISNYMLHVDGIKSNATQSGHASTSKLLPGSSYKNEQTNASQTSMEKVKNDTGVSHFTARPRCEGYFLVYPGKRGWDNVNPDYLHFPFWSVRDPPVKPTDEYSKIKDIDDETWNNFAQEITLQLKLDRWVGYTSNLLYIGCWIFYFIGKLILFFITLFLIIVCIAYSCSINNNIDKVIDKYHHKFREKGVDVKRETYLIVFSTLPHPLVLNIV
ncbi:predicted protein [Chaetoceros tenuissimus]|uniref:Uncharacterized protein n=1 Tax=Chaetoceros tenuissimus TaxID=426638 RepID=A0AAD3CP03_9STRA|nr:predicted protein [Chaetoceros tenuissimus]